MDLVNEILYKNMKMFHLKIEKDLKKLVDQGHDIKDLVVEYEVPEIKGNVIKWRAKVRPKTENEKQRDLEKEIGAIEKLLKQMDKDMFETYITTA